MPLIRTQDRDLYYEDTGGGAPTVILAHGYGLDCTMFADLAKLVTRCRLIVWDTRGHGRTAEDFDSFTYWDLARDLLGLMDELCIEKAVVGGVSQGGFIALRAALLAPNRISSLALFGTEASSCPPDDAVRYRHLFNEFAARGPVDDLVLPLATQIIGDHPAANMWVQRWKRRGVPLGSAAECLLLRDDIVRQLGKIRCPALLSRGEYDVSIPSERMKILRDHLPYASPIHVIPGAGHSAPLTHPRETNAILSKFLDKFCSSDIG